MKNLPIGVFDSGIGGISVLLKSAKLFPNEKFVYLGDNGNVPYGNKTVKEINDLTLNGINTLYTYGVKAVILACNTASTAWLGGDDVNGVRIFKLLPNINGALVSGKSVCFLGTAATVEMCRKKNFLSSNKISYYPQRKLAENIEKSILSGKKLELDDHLMTIVKKHDYIYLGCTHYLFAQDVIKNVCKGKIFFDGTSKLFQNLRFYLRKYNLLATGSQTVKFIGEYAETNARVFNANINKCLY